MAYMCMSCLKEYFHYGLNLTDKVGYESRCPSVDCGDLAVVEIDDLIAPSIKMLNEKGYYTLFCCSGHHYEYQPNTYIVFYDDRFPDNAPEGFVIEDKEYYKQRGWKSYDNKITIRKSYKDSDNIAEDILKTALDLLRWANELDYIEE